MLRHVFIASMLLLGWAMHVGANGEVYTVLVDPRTGVVLPSHQTPVEVQGEQLTIRFSPNVSRADPFADVGNIQRIEVQARYKLFNPLDKPVRLDIAFSITDTVTFPRPPVRWDDKLIEWRYLDKDEVLALFRPQMKLALEQARKQNPTLDALLREAYDVYRSKGHDDAYFRVLQPKLVGRSTPDYWVRSLLEVVIAQGKGKEADAWDLLRALKAVGKHDQIPWRRWGAKEVYLHPLTGHLVSAQDILGEGDSEEWFSATLLLFTVELQPKGRHRLTVMYHQPPGVGHEEGAANDDLIPGYHLCYLLNTRSWAKFGPIEVTVAIPKSYRLRSAPRLDFVGISGDWRQYHIRLNDPQGNLHIVAATPETFWLAALKVNNQWEGYKVTLLNRRAYVAVTDFFEGYRWHWHEGKAILNLDKGRALRLKPGSAKALLDDKEIALSTAPIVQRARLYVHVQDAVMLRDLLHNDRPPKHLSTHYNPRTGVVNVTLVRADRR